jgi:hypothetical protein
LAALGTERASDVSDPGIRGVNVRQLIAFV